MSDFVTRCDLLWPGGYLGILTVVLLSLEQIMSKFAHGLNKIQRSFCYLVRWCNFVTRKELLWPGVTRCSKIVSLESLAPQGPKTTHFDRLGMPEPNFAISCDQHVTRCDQMQRICIFGIACTTVVQDHSYWPPWHPKTEFHNFVWPACDQVCPDRKIDNNLAPAGSRYPNIQHTVFLSTCQLKATKLTPLKNLLVGLAWPVHPTR